MEKEIGQIKFTETDDGYRVEVKGKSLKDALGCCGCVPMFGGGKMIMGDCCAPGGAKKEDCCPPKEEKK